MKAAEVAAFYEIKPAVSDDVHAHENSFTGLMALAKEKAASTYDRLAYLAGISLPRRQVIKSLVVALLDGLLGGLVAIGNAQSLVPAARLAGVASLIVAINPAVLPVGGLGLYLLGDGPGVSPGLMAAGITLTVPGTGPVYRPLRTVATREKALV